MGTQPVELHAVLLPSSTAKHAALWVFVLVSWLPGSCHELSINAQDAFLAAQ
jgi:hypothetical protein